MTLTLAIKEQARSLGFDLARIIPLGPPRHAPQFAAWLAAGLHGEMGYLAARAELRADPAALAPGARSIIMLAANYNPGPPPAGWDEPGRGRIARYAWSPDYHDVIKQRLFTLDAFIRRVSGRAAPGKVCVDTAPFLERDFAQQAGLGFTGKNTVLITPGLGSWTFLAALLVPEVLIYDDEPRAAPTREWPLGQAAGSDVAPTPGRPVAVPLRWQLQGVDGAPRVGTCGLCRRCLTACPTRAFAGPYVLDSRRCISYLTIELRGSIPRELRPLLGNWVFGCDVCQEVCPYNRDTAVATWPELAADPDRAAPSLLALLALDEAAFHARYRGTAVLRTKRRGLVRNACVAAGNWRDPAARPALVALLGDAEPIVRGHAAWALGCLGGRAATAALDRAAATETDPYVQDEIAAARLAGAAS
jgi:epoxyqueuosine reductase